MTMTMTVAPPGAQTAGLALRNLAIAGAAVMLALLPATILAYLTDPRALNGASVWLKPMHFELAFAVHFATLALLVPLLSPSWQRSRLIGWSLLIPVFCTVLEVLYISLQAARGRASHFNQETPLEIAMYAFMGLGATLIVSGSGLFGYGIWRSPAPAGATKLRQGAALGLMLGSAATLLIAGYMSQLHGHLVGGPHTDAFGLPFLGWATRGGDLRVPHFFATHAMQALPLAGLLADRVAGPKSAWLMPGLAVLYFIGVAALVVEALLGIAFIAV